MCRYYGDLCCVDDYCISRVTHVSLVTLLAHLNILVCVTAPRFMQVHVCDVEFDVFQPICSMLACMSCSSSVYIKLIAAVLRAVVIIVVKLKSLASSSSQRMPVCLLYKAKLLYP